MDFEEMQNDQTQVKEEEQESLVSNANFQLVFFIIIQTNQIVNIKLSLLAGVLYLIFGTVFYWQKINLSGVVYDTGDKDGYE